MKQLIKQVAHACFGVKDLEITKQFYTDVLGFDIVHRFLNESNNLYGLIFSTGNGTFLEFFLNKDEIATESYFRHLCFSVVNIEEVKKRLNSFGYDLQIYRGRTDLTLQSWIIDPNGIQIEFHEYDEHSLLTKFQKE